MRSSLGAKKKENLTVRINEDQMRSNEEQLRTRKRKNSSGEDQ